MTLALGDTYAAMGVERRWVRPPPQLSKRATASLQVDSSLGACQLLPKAAGDSTLSAAALRAAGDSTGQYGARFGTRLCALSQRLLALPFCCKTTDKNKQAKQTSKTKHALALLFLLGVWPVVA